jgi:hypothetical protein
MRYCCRKLLAGTRDTEAVCQEARFYCAGTDPANLYPKAEPRYKQIAEAIKLKLNLIKIKKQDLTHIWIHAIL